MRIRSMVSHEHTYITVFAGKMAQVNGTVADLSRAAGSSGWPAIAALHPGLWELYWLQAAAFASVNKTPH